MVSIFREIWPTNFEIHGEFAYLTDLKQNYLSETGTLTQKEHSANRYLLGLRYLTESDITTIVEYYHNGAGFFRIGIGAFLSIGCQCKYTTAQYRSRHFFTRQPKIFPIWDMAAPRSGRNYLYLKTQSERSIRYPLFYAGRNRHSEP